MNRTHLGALRDPADSGRRAEDCALRHLQRSGLKLIARNFRCRLGELDLVMEHGTHLVFVEVRMRRNSRFGGGGASVNQAKQRRLTRAAGVFLQRHPRYAQRPCRFDVISVTGGGDDMACSWIADAFC